MGRNLFYEKRFSPYPSSKSLDEEYEKKCLQKYLNFWRIQVYHLTIITCKYCEVFNVAEFQQVLILLRETRNYG